MAEQENVQTVKEAYAAFERGDIPSLLNLVSEDVEWSLPGPSDIIPFAGEFRGREGVGRFFAALGGAEDVEIFEPQEFVAQGDKVVALGQYRWRVKQSGREYGGDWAHVFTVRDGKIAGFHEYMDTAAAADAYK